MCVGAKRKLLEIVETTSAMSCGMPILNYLLKKQLKDCEPLLSDLQEILWDGCLHPVEVWG